MFMTRVQVKDRPVSAAEIYDDWSNSYEAGILNMGWSAPQSLFENVSEHLPDKPEIYEVGIGSGFLAEKFKQSHDAEIYGADISSKMLDLLHEKGIAKRNNIHHLNLETQSIPAEKHSMDAVISCGVLEYFEDIDHVLDEMIRITKPGGVIGLSFETSPEIDHKKTLARSNADALSEDGQKLSGTFFYYHHPLGHLLQTLEQAGFEVCHQDYKSSVKKAEETPIIYGEIIAKAPEIPI